MNLFNFFKRQGTAPVARDRLQILLAYERGSTRGAPDLLAILREEILTAVGRHVQIDSNRVNVRMDRGEKVSTLEVDIEIPNAVRMAPMEAVASERCRCSDPHPDRVALALRVRPQRRHNSEISIFFCGGTKLPLICRPLPLPCLRDLGGSFPVRRRTLQISFCVSA